MDKFLKGSLTLLDKCGGLSVFLLANCRFSRFRMLSRGFRCLDIILGEGINARTINMRIKPFTLIGATTRAGMLSAPLRDRFATREHLGFYSLPELTEIVRRSSKKLSVKLDEANPDKLARRGSDSEPGTDDKTALGVSVAQLSGVLLGLELKKLIRRLPGNRYERW